VVFRNLLLVQCQHEFQKEKADESDFEEKLKAIEAAETPEKKAELKAELEMEQTKARRRSLGNIRFIGELFKLGVILEKIMHECVQKVR
jgi:translation initiation factor 4G